MSTRPVALVTGASGSMGQQIARQLLQEGCAVVLTDTDPDGMQTLRRELPDAPLLVEQGDVTDIGSMEGVFAAARTAFGDVTILVNNAGVLRPTSLTQIGLDEWRWILDVNLTGSFICTKMAAPAMQSSGFGRIINISSSAGRSVSTIGGAHYTASKAGLLGLTRHAARELAADGITVNAVCPGLIETEMVSRTIPPSHVERLASTFPVGRLGDAREVAAVVAFLSSPEASYVTGASIDVNGGDLMI